MAQLPSLLVLRLSVRLLRLRLVLALPLALSPLSRPTAILEAPVIRPRKSSYRRWTDSSPELRRQGRRARQQERALEVAVKVLQLKASNPKVLLIRDNQPPHIRKI
jgi:hypothetical protein